MRKLFKVLSLLLTFVMCISLFSTISTSAAEPVYNQYEVLNGKTGRPGQGLKRKITSYGWGWIEADTHPNDLPEGGNIVISFDGKDSPIKGTTKQDVYGQPSWKFKKPGTYELKFQMTYPEEADLSAKSTLYYKYVINIEKSPVDVTYMDGDQEVDFQGYDSNASLADMPKMPDKDGKHFAGWYTEKDGKGVRMAEGMSVKSQDLTLYAHYTQDIAVTFLPGTLGYLSDNDKANSGVVKVIPAGMSVDEVPVVNLYRPASFKFVGWAVQGTEEIVDPKTMKFDAPTTLVAQYKENDAKADPRDPNKEKNIDQFFEYSVDKEYKEGGSNKVASVEISTSKEYKAYSVEPKELNGIKAEAIKSEENGRHVYKFTFPGIPTKIGYHNFTINYTESNGAEKSFKVVIYVSPNYNVSLYYKDGTYSGVKVPEELKEKVPEAAVAVADAIVTLTENIKSEDAQKVLSNFTPVPAAGYFFAYWLNSNKDVFKSLTDFVPHYAESLTANYKKMPLQVSLKKVDKSKNDLPLAGAKFDLYYVNDSGARVLVKSGLVSDSEGYIYGQGLSGPAQFKTNKELKDLTLDEKTVFEKDKGYYQNGENIYLVNGKYVLVEKEAPNGYKLGQDFEFTLNQDTSKMQDDSKDSQAFVIGNTPISQAEKYVPTPATITVEEGAVPKSDDGVGNIKELPDGTKTEFKTGTPEMTKPGTYPVVIVITYPDGSSEEIETKVVVKEKVNNNGGADNNGGNHNDIYVPMPDGNNGLDVDSSKLNTKLPSTGVK